MTWKPRRKGQVLSPVHPVSAMYIISQCTPCIRIPDPCTPVSALHTLYSMYLPLYPLMHIIYLTPCIAQVKCDLETSEEGSGPESRRNEYKTWSNVREELERVRESIVGLLCEYIINSIPESIVNLIRDDSLT